MLKPMRPFVLFVLALVPFVASAQAQTSELAELQATNPDLFYSLGRSVSLSGDRALVTGAGASSGLFGAGGSAIIFERQPNGSWVQTAKLLPPGGVNEIYFGHQGSLSGDRALVGSENSVVYVYEIQPGGTWVQVAQLAKPGRSFSLSGDRALVAGGETAYIFERQPGGAWIEVASVSPGDLYPILGVFGISSSLSGDRALVGTYRNGPSGSCCPVGAAYLFERRPDGSWIQIAKLTQPSTALSAIGFGHSVSLSDDRAIVGASGNSVYGQSYATSGSAYLYERQTNGAWIQTAKINAAGAAGGDQFGISVSLVGDRALIGASGTALNGAAHLFDRQPDGTWVQTDTLVASNGGVGDQFGLSVSLSADRALVGKPYEMLSGYKTGSAYAFDLFPLSAKTAQISVSSGGVQQLEIDAGHLHAGETYLLLGSASGSTPGIPLPEGFTIPLNIDSYFSLTLTNPNSAALGNSFGTLNAAGYSLTTLNLPPGASASFIGTTLHHAFLTLPQGNPVVSFVSNATVVELVP